MRQVTIVYADIWNGDRTNSSIFGVFKTKEKAIEATNKYKLPPFSDYRYETWNVEGNN